MASYHELKFDWSMLCDECAKWTQNDVQIAAELGKNLLERNQELERTLHECHMLIDDQRQEIDYLTKQKMGLHEVNDSRLKIYENLEINIQDLERHNRELSYELSNVKKDNKKFNNQIETLELKNEELVKQLDDLKRRQSHDRRQRERLENEKEKLEEKVLLRSVNRNSYNEFIGINDRDEENSIFSSEHQDLLSTHTFIDNLSFTFISPQRASHESLNSTPIQRKLLTEIEMTPLTQKDQSAEIIDNMKSSDDHSECCPDILKLISDLETTNRFLTNEQQKVSELEDQINGLIEENRSLQRQIESKPVVAEEVITMHAELSSLDEVRRGKMCNRCLRRADTFSDFYRQKPFTSNLPKILDSIEVDVKSKFESINCSSKRYCSTAFINIENKINIESSNKSNPYDDQIAKYEALFDNEQLSKPNFNDLLSNGHRDLIPYNPEIKKDFLKVNKLIYNAFDDKSSSHRIVLQSDDHKLTNLTDENKWTISLNTPRREPVKRKTNNSNTKNKYYPKIHRLWPPQMNWQPLQYLTVTVKTRNRKSNDRHTERMQMNTSMGVQGKPVMWWDGTAITILPASMTTDARLHSKNPKTPFPLSVQDCSKFARAATNDLKKLIKLDTSYAELLRKREQYSRNKHKAVNSIVS